MKTSAIFCFVAITFSNSAQDFVNLSFDSPDLTCSLRPYDPLYPRTPFIGETSCLLRGWTLLGNGVPLNEIYYSPGSRKTLDPVTMIPIGDGENANNRLIIHSLSLRPVDLRFQQTGRIPADAVGFEYFANGPMEMLINGRLLYTVDTKITTTPVVDVSEFAGQTVNLEFHVFQRPFSGALFEFDINGFTQIPEPSTWALFCVGAAGFAWGSRFCRHA
jgi:hypothetical protein